MPPVAREDKRRLLRSVVMFSGLSDAEIDQLLQATRGQSFKAREEIFHKGDEGTQVYVVVSGTLKALTTSDEGDDVVFSILGPGELFGEIAFLGTTDRTATVTGISNGELLVIDRRDFLAFLRSNPEASIKLLAVLAKRLKHVSELVEDTLFLNLPVRLAKKLINYSAVYGEQTPEGTRIDLKLSQEEWGDLVGATRESINKQMRAWTEEGLLTTERGYITIRRMTDLERLAGAIIA